MSNCFTCQNQFELSNPFGQCLKEETMSKRAEEAALKVYPQKFIEGRRFSKRIQSPKTDTHVPARAVFVKGYKQAMKDLSLTWEDIAKIITIYEEGVDNGDYRRYNEAEWMKEYSQDILRRFNEMKGGNNETK